MSVLFSGRFFSCHVATRSFCHLRQARATAPFVVNRRLFSKKGYGGQQGDEDEEELKRSSNEAIHRCTQRRHDRFHNVAELASSNQRTQYHYTTRESGDAITKSGRIQPSGWGRGSGITKSDYGKTYTTEMDFNNAPSDIMMNNWGTRQVPPKRLESVIIANVEDTYVHDAGLKTRGGTAQDIKITGFNQGIGLNKVERWERRDVVGTIGNPKEPIRNTYAVTESGSNSHAYKETSSDMFGSTGSLTTSSERRQHGWLTDKVTKTKTTQSQTSFLGLKMKGKEKVGAKEQTTQLSSHGSAMVGGAASQVAQDLLTRGKVDGSTAKGALANCAQNFAQSSLSKGIENISNCGTTGVLGAAAVTEVISTVARGGSGQQVAASTAKTVVRSAVSREAIKRAGACSFTRTGYLAAGMAAVESVGHVANYAKGDISGEECVKRTARSATVAGCAVAGAEAGACMGAVAGPVGAVVGGAVGGVLGSILGGKFWQ